MRRNQGTGGEETRTLTVRKISVAVHDALRVRAAEKGRSVEEHVRNLLAEEAGRRTRVEQEAALRELQEHVKNLYGGKLPGNVVDEFLKEKREEAKREWLKDMK